MVSQCADVSLTPQILCLESFSPMFWFLPFSSLETTVGAWSMEVRLFCMSMESKFLSKKSELPNRYNCTVWGFCHQFPSSLVSWESHCQPGGDVPSELKSSLWDIFTFILTNSKHPLKENDKPVYIITPSNLTQGLTTEPSLLSISTEDNPQCLNWAKSLHSVFRQITQVPLLETKFQG